jgi:CheY-like chemotaxis protein
VSARPVLLTVDDDASVSRAVSRDLRRRYGADHRIVRAESGPDALEALREFTLRGEDTALLLADHRMPGMTGVEFLELAMDVAPSAKRVLLTAYADTDAAIRAINDVDLDRYLLKPWDPPEERLYPVLDELLAEWRAGSRPSFTGITVLGHQWSAETQAAKEFLARNQVPYRHLDVTEPAGARLLAATGVPDDTPLPVVLLPSGEVLHRPSLRELARGRGCRPRPAARSTTSSWSAAARPGSGRRCTAPARGCGRCSSSGPRRAGRPVRAAGSRTTSASRRGCPVPSSPSGPATRRCASGSRSSPPRRSPPSSRTATGASSTSATRRA